MNEHGRGAPSTKGYEISAFETRAFMAACGLDPKEVEQVVIRDKRVIATLTDGSAIAIPIRDSRG